MPGRRTSSARRALSSVGRVFLAGLTSRGECLAGVQTRGEFWRFALESGRGQTTAMVELNLPAIARRYDPETVLAGGLRVFLQTAEREISILTHRLDGGIWGPT
jgi:hypothetical protein